MQSLKICNLGFPANPGSEPVWPFCNHWMASGMALTKNLKKQDTMCDRVGKKITP